MPKIIVKPRAGGRSAQLVRSVYSKDLRRSVTVNVGSISASIEPAGLPAGIRLVQGQTLAAMDIEKIRQWLTTHRQPTYPTELVRQIEKEVEARLRASFKDECIEQSAESDMDDEPEAQLLNALKIFNQACATAQAAFKRLPKGHKVAAQTILEYQKTWYTNQAMGNALKIKPCFHRPGGWSELRQQILSGCIYKKGDAVHVN
ncbi:hypothetical protein [Noviherbaspirillum sp. UKPF54]|uniref:hypothetical protein n=1 Tax=Noviherbaspirillum sp. UKPF54 TaxID=2601898 RepID=UPI0011B183D6|nr:hypothetical protein [Noviherbaspirillum sp. UKPF54]QDZ26582.1 hypothetical protein FAY22_00520 [Noviherbaspirillum sp. UKPF54]